MTVHHITKGDRFCLKGKTYVVKNTVSVLADGRYQLRLVDTDSGETSEVVFKGVECILVKTRYVPVDRLKEALKHTFDSNSLYHNIYQIEKDHSDEDVVLLVYLY